MTVPGSPEWELDVARRDFNMAGRLVRECQARLDMAYEQLVDAAEAHGQARAKHETG